MVSLEERSHIAQAVYDDEPVKATAMEVEVAVLDTAETTSVYFNKWTKKEAGQLVGFIK